MDNLIHILEQKLISGQAKLLRDQLVSVRNDGCLVREGNGEDKQNRNDAGYGIEDEHCVYYGRGTPRHCKWVT